MTDLLQSQEPRKPIQQQTELPADSLCLSEGDVSHHQAEAGQHSGDESAPGCPASRQEQDLHYKDYFHQLLCITEREEFIVPVCATGASAIPDSQASWTSQSVGSSAAPRRLCWLETRAAHCQLSTQSNPVLSWLFSLCNVDQQPLAADSKAITFSVGEELRLCIQFNPTYENNLNSWVAERVLRTCFMEHPHEDQITVQGEVYFPNLHLQTQAMDFGCNMNDTEQVLYVEMTNCSPIPAQYHWSFQTDSQTP
ncbi:hydrocephalus-inducing protein homolog [Agelaius tricolor]|uniref:hydrocephalus-inducing protein homolog n=1 Tax=Agelaius tricolor TaxID=9191 RepID=UPI0039F23421